MLEEYNRLIELFTKLDTTSKREQIIEDIKVMIAILQKICNDRNIYYEPLLNKELLDLKNNPLSEDDYLEALYVYLCWLKELVGGYFNRMEFHE